MDYQLAKELKDAGFPQNDRHFYWSDHTTAPTWWCINAWELKDPFVPSKHLTADPTLPELIEACEDEFEMLEQIAPQDWLAYGEDVENQIGHTPEIAVARLWLALNKK